MKTLTGLVAVLLVGCAGNYFTFDEVRRVKTGMSEQEVIEIMGKPTVITAFDGKQMWRYAYGTALGQGGAASFVLSNKTVIQIPEVPDSFK